MKVSVEILPLLLCLVTAEPPVGDYLPPSQTDFNIPSSNYGPPSIQYGVPRGFSANTQLPSTQYGIPDVPSAQYGVPNEPSAEYGVPNIPSIEYGVPDGGLPDPSSEYGTLLNTNQYGAPFSNGLKAPTGFSNNGNFGGRPSSSYGVSKLSGSNTNRLSNSYGPPRFEQSRPSTSYGPPVSSGVTTAIFKPNTAYGVPNSQGSTNAYLPPSAERYANGDNNYDTEPNYSFEYMVKDDAYGTDFGHRESRRGDFTQGRYYVLLPDGRKQIVEYEADVNGYRPKVSYEENAGTAGGYPRGPTGHGVYSPNGGYANGDGYNY